MWYTGALLLAAGTSALEEFTVYTEPISLLPGQVHNNPVKPVALPDWVVKKYATKPMGVVKFQLDIVEHDGFGTANEKRVPLYDFYNHHTIQMMGTMQRMTDQYNDWHNPDPLGPHSELHRKPMPACNAAQSFKTMLKTGRAQTGGQEWSGPVGGAEYRDADRDLPSPYRQVVDTPEAMIAILHFINIKSQGTDPADYPRLFECPCTSQRHIDPANGTVDGVVPLPFNCNADLIAEQNPDCKLAWYKGGYRCCEDGVFVTEHPNMNAEKSVVVGKFTFTIDDVSIFTKKAYSINFDCTSPSYVGGGAGLPGNAEYSVNPGLAGSKCDHNGCIHTVDTVQVVSPEAVKAYGPDFKIELLTARGHQHVAGLGMQLYNNETGELLCQSHPRHGNGTEAGNEDGYIVGVPPCVWGTPGSPPPVLRAADKIRIVSKYNSTVNHHGVMCFFFAQIAIGQ